jgi:hypothetical protein
METIHRALDDCPLPDVRVCRHLARTDSCNEPFAYSVQGLKQCANCQGYLCADCEDDAVICHACPAAICEECQEKARRRVVGWTGDRMDMPHNDYLCNPCCAKQDAAQTELLHAMDTAAIRGEWLDDIVENLEAEIEKAKEAL